jgi:DNA-binding transcriptional ArsR family regulator
MRDGNSPPPLSTFDWLKLIRDVRMPAPVKNVAAWLCSFGDADGTHIYPGVDKLTLATGLSRDTAVQALAALRESGLVVRTKRGGGRGSRKSDEYQIGVPVCCDSPDQLGNLVTAAYESAKPTRKSQPPAQNESACPIRKAEGAKQYESDLRTYESDFRLYESAQPTPPTSHQSLDQPANKAKSPYGPDVEVAEQADESVENDVASSGDRWRLLAARQLSEARAARGAT